jgi:hypothetical protein
MWWFGPQVGNGDMPKVIDPNFGDYTDNACDVGSAYFTWSDGRLGYSQPFVAP